MLSPQEVAEKLTIKEYTILSTDVENMYHQKFSVESIKRQKNGVVVVVELENKTQHMLMIKS